MTDQPPTDWRDTPDCIACGRHDCENADQCRARISGMLDRVKTRTEDERAVRP